MPTIATDLRVWNVTYSHKGQGYRSNRQLGVAARTIEGALAAARQHLAEYEDVVIWSAAHRGPVHVMEESSEEATDA